MRVEAERFELVERPAAGLIELGRTGEAWADAVGEIGKIGTKLRLIGLHLCDEFAVHFRKGIGRGSPPGLSRGVRWFGSYRPARKHAGKLRRVVRPRSEDLRALV